MAITAEPFDNGPYMYEAGWSLMWAASMLDGVVPLTSNSLQIFTDTDGRQVKMRAGSAIIQGKRFTSDSVEIIPVSTNSSGFERRDLVVLRLDTTAKTIRPAVVPGTPNSGQWPALTRQTGGIWEVNLGLLTLANGFTSIPSNVLEDARSYAVPKVAPGKVEWINATDAPAGYVIPTGQTYKRAKYPDAFAVIGTRHNPGVASDSFTMPDIRGKMPLGVSGSYALGATGGAVTATLSVANLANHGHNVHDPGHEHSIDGDYGNRVVVTAGGLQSNSLAGPASPGESFSDIDLAYTGISVENTGSGSPFSTISPYIVLTPIMKVH